LLLKNPLKCTKTLNVPQKIDGQVCLIVQVCFNPIYSHMLNTENYR